MNSKRYLIPKCNIVLIEPEIPPNTGSIARLAVGIGASLHLVGKLGFTIDNKHLKRAGIDFWEYIDLHSYDSFDEFMKKNINGRFFYATTKTDRLYTSLNYEVNDYFIFGKETKGLPEELLRNNLNSTITIPMADPMRSLNLSNAVSVITYEFVRQFLK